MEEELSAQWSVLDLEGVSESIEWVTSRVARNYEVEYDDLLQEARSRAARVPDLLACFDYDNDLTLGAFQFRLERDLVKIAQREVRGRHRMTSLEITAGIEQLERPATIAIRKDVKDYDRELVEALVPGIWDEAYCYGMQVENAPDHDMPRGSTNKATGNVLAAHLADIRSAWKRAPLSLGEKQAIFLVVGQDWTQGEAGRHLNVPQRTISHRVYTGVGKLVALLNGDYAHMFSLCDEANEVTA